MSKGLTDSNEKVPQTFKGFIAKFPELGEAHEQVAKAIDKAMVIEGVRLIEKTGGKSGDYRAEGEATR